MRFIKKKNFQEGEELLYIPRLHWMYTIRHIVLSLPFFLLLLIVWAVIKANSGPGWLLGAEAASFSIVIIKWTILAAVIIELLIFIWKIFLYLNTEYGITNKRLIIKRGIIKLFISEIPTDRIESIYCLQGLMGRFFHYGTIYISGIGGRLPTLYMVSKPYSIRRKLVDVVEKNKTITVVHGNDLPKAPAQVKAEPEVKEEPIYRYGTFVRVIGK